MSDLSEQTLAAIHEVRDLLRLIAEPQIAARDRKWRDDLLRIVGSSKARADAVLLMDGNHTQAAIHKKIKMHTGNLSTLVKRLSAGGLLIEDGKQPRLAISIPPNFFDTNL